MLRCLDPTVDERYEKLGEVGRGGMGVVYRARDRQTGAVVALKVLEHASLEDAARFEREQRLLSMLGEADGFVPLLDRGTTSGRPWIVMPFLEAGTLADRLKRGGRLGVAEVVALGRTLARAAGRAHAAGIVHRDLTPANVLFAKNGAPLVADLGLAKHFRTDVPGATGSEDLTGSGELFGTLHYMAPEQLLDSRSARPPADVFSLGVLLFECLALAHPFPGKGLVALLKDIQEGRWVSIESLRPDVPRRLAAVIERCLRATPEERFADGADLERALAAVEHAPRVSLWPAAVAAVLLVLLGGVARARSPRSHGGAPAKDRGEWRTVWRTGDRPDPELGSRALWEDDSGLEAAPLAGLVGGEIARLAPAFRGTVVFDGQRVVHRPDLAAARTIFERPASWVAYGPVGLQRTETEIRAAVPSDAAGLVVPLGEARWRDPRVTLTARAQRRDGGFRALVIGADQGSELVYVASRPPDGEVRVGREREPGLGTEGAFDLLYAPGAAPGERVGFGGRFSSTLGPHVALPRPGRIFLRIVGVDWLVSEVAISGRPERADVPAMALARIEPLGDARICASFARKGPGLGGPFVALGAGGPDALRLELDEETLVLSRGGAVVARASTGRIAPPSEGTLELERTGGLVRGRARGDGFSVQLEVADPLGGAPARPGYGSTAPRVRFSEVVVAAPREVRPPGDATARARWREGALRLAQLSDPAYLDSAAVQGTAARRADTRKERARDARRSLVVAAASLEDPTIRRDAFARAVLAAVLAGDEKDARALAERFAKAEGAGPAARTVDALEREYDAPVLLRRLAEGYVVHDSLHLGCEQGPVVLAGAAAAAALSPDLESAAWVVRARAAYAVADLDRTIEHCRRAADLGAVGSAVETVWGDAHSERGLALGDAPGARDELELGLRHWERALDTLIAPSKLLALHDSLAAHYSRLADRQEAAGDRGAALESLLGAVAHGVEQFELVRRYAASLGAAEVAERLRRLRELVERARRLAWALGADRRPGLAVAAQVAVAHADARIEEREVVAPDSVPMTYGISQRHEDQTERELGAYAFACVSAKTAEPPPDSTSPTGVLLRARLARARSQDLEKAAERSALVEHLVRLDPVLAAPLWR